MKTKLILTIIFTLLTSHAAATPIDDKCPQFVSKYGAPIPKIKMDGIYECHNKYAVFVSPSTKDPIFVVEHLTKEGLICTVKRKNNFHADTALPADKRATPQDYDNSGYDQGHMASAQDQCDNAADESDSFLMSNMVPQNPSNNRGIWKRLEIYSRALAKVDSVYVVSGPVFVGSTHKTIGKGVVVPEKLFKVVYDETTGITRSWILPNEAVEFKDLKKYEVSMDAILLATGLIVQPKK